jgi:hypothetical protein
MPLMNPYWVLLANLAEYLDSDRMDYLPKEVARQRLCEISAIDFGYDIQKWNEWLISANLIAAGEFHVWKRIKVDENKGGGSGFGVEP